MPEPLMLKPLSLAPLMLEPLSLAPLMLGPLSLTPLMLAPLMLEPLSLAPLMLEPLSLEPLMLEPLMLKPLSLKPLTLTKNHFNLLMFTIEPYKHSSAPALADVRQITPSHFVAIIPHRNGSTRRSYVRQSNAWVMARTL
jgi:hypothetical protein